MLRFVSALYGIFVLQMIPVVVAVAVVVVSVLFFLQKKKKKKLPVTLQDSSVKYPLPLIEKQVRQTEPGL